MHSSPAYEIREKVTSGALSAEELISSCLSSSKNSQSSLNAFISIAEDQVIAKAKEIDRKRKENRPLGKLAGVPVALKDNLHLKGVKTTNGSLITENYVSVYNATVVDLLEKEDALLFAKTNMDEFAMGSSGVHSAFGPSMNPWNLSYVPGGSSSGSAVAVSAGLCPLSLGSETGGSVRLPASYTGIIGFKPSYGRISRFGLTAYGSSLDCIAPFARNMRDLALILEVIARPCHRDATSVQFAPPQYSLFLDKPIEKMKIGVPNSLLKELSPSMRSHFESSLKVFQEQEAELVDIDLSILHASIAIYYILATAEASTNLARFDGIRYGHRAKGAASLEKLYMNSRKEGFGWEVKNRILLGTYVLSASQKDAYYIKAQKARRLAIEAMRKAFTVCHMIAMPTSPGPATPLDANSDPLQEYLQDLYTIPASLGGLPAISIPSGFTSEGLPLGLQLIGPQLKDELVLQFASAFCKQVPYWKETPPNFGGTP